MHPSPEWIIYEEMTSKQVILDSENQSETSGKRHFLKYVSEIKDYWIPSLGSKLLMASEIALSRRT